MQNQLENLIANSNLSPKERKEIRREYCVLKRRAHLGFAAAKVVHDSNNSLTVIGGNASLVKMLLTEGKPVEQIMPLVEQIEKSTQSLYGMNAAVLNFARGEKVEFSRVYLNQIVNDSFGNLNQIVALHNSYNYPLVLDLNSKEEIEGNLISISEALENFVKNAKEAQAQANLKEGNIVISTRDIKYNKPQVNSYGVVPAGFYAVLSVRDNGIGIKPEDLDKIKKEPAYFTTKGKEHGTGLGLVGTICTAEAHSGYLSIGTEVGKGSEFSIYFPVVKAE